MKIAKEKVWADEKGNLVPDGDEAAAVLVAAAGQTVPDSQVDQYKNGNKFFKDATFDSNAQPVLDKVIAPAKPAASETFHMVNDGPAPTNREESMPKLKTRAAKKPRAKKAAK